MSLLVALTWDPQPWVERLTRSLPDREIVVLGGTCYALALPAIYLLFGKELPTTTPTENVEVEHMISPSVMPRSSAGSRCTTRAREMSTTS